MSPQGLTQLRRLEVQGAARLECVSAGAFAANLNLETLVLSSNKLLEDLEPGALAALPKLRELVLRDNGFVSLPESLLAAWPTLRRLDLSENPLHCACALLWLRDLLLTSNASQVRLPRALPRPVPSGGSAVTPACLQVLCASPPHVKERPLRLLSPDELGCALPAVKRNILLGVSVAVALALVALLGGLAWHYRRRLCAAVKEHRWKKKRAAKEHEYHKTFSEDEYVVRAHQQQLKPIPVTEL